MRYMRPDLGERLATTICHKILKRLLPGGRMLQRIAGLALALLVAYGPIAETFAQSKRSLPRLRGMTYAHSSASDFQDLRAIGANVIVYQLTIPAVLVDSASVTEYRALLAQSLASIDPLVEICGAIGLKMVLVLSSPPGGAASIANPPLHRVFAEKAFQDELTVTWQTIATRYKDKPGIFGFDLLNEPQQRSVAAGLESWKTLAPSLIKTIRAIDPTRFIFIQPPYGNPDLLANKTAVVKDPLVAYNIHTYFPSNFRTQGLNGRPINVVYPRGKLNKARLAASVSKVIRFQAKNKVQIFIGEFAAPRWAPNNSALRYLRDYINIFESRRWGWALHAWREADVWSIEHTTDPLNPNPSPTKTDRQMLIEKFFSRNS
jgi:endoglucanase